MHGELSQADVLSILRKNPGRAFRLRELVTELGLRSSQARRLRRVLHELVAARQIVRSRKDQFLLASERPRKPAVPYVKEVAATAHAPGGRAAKNTVTGRLVGHRDGYGFVVPDEPLEGTDQDIFIPRDGVGSALHGDRVEVQVVRARPDWRRRPAAGERAKLRVEGRVVRVLDRAQKTVVGEFLVGARANHVLPYERRIPVEIVIPRGQERPPEAENRAGRNRQFGGESEGRRRHGTGALSAREMDHMIVDVELTQYPGPGVQPRGRVIEILGRREDFGVDVEIVIRKFHLPHRFPAEVLSEAEAAPQYISDHERKGRRDFRGLPIVTIDGETAKDFDDAVYVERRPDGHYVLQVHIADVAHYIRPATALDREARLRGTSVYFPDRAVPMLPLELSNGVCSLNPQVDRLVMSVLMEMDSQGRIVECEIVPGVIHSAERMTYTAVRDILAGEPVALERYSTLAENFRWMEELAQILNRRRQERGSIDFDLPEPEIEFDRMGRMVGVTRSERNIAHRLIEEFMLAANESVAGYLERQGVPALYRIHEKPDPKKVLEFEEIAATLGYSLGVKLPSLERHRVRARDERERYPRFHEEPRKEEMEITPHHYQRLTQRLEGKPEERIISYLMLRSLKQAKYSEENLGHFALAAATYTHFTSPIRRYPDLMVHRVLKAVLEEKGGRVRYRPSGTPSPGSSHPARRAPIAPISLEELHALGLETSEAERRAQEAERELLELKKIAFMSERLGEEFDGLIISLIKQGFFVELADLFVEGFVPLDSLDDGRYVYRESLRAIVSRDSKRAFRLGERIRVRLVRIDRTGNKLEFSVVG
jgi:ribonuclease R